MTFIQNIPKYLKQLQTRLTLIYFNPFLMYFVSNLSYKLYDNTFYYLCIWLYIILLFRGTCQRVNWLFGNTNVYYRHSFPECFVLFWKPSLHLYYLYYDLVVIKNIFNTHKQKHTYIHIYINHFKEKCNNSIHKTFTFF